MPLSWPLMILVFLLILALLLSIGLFLKERSANQALRMLQLEQSRQNAETTLRLEAFDETKAKAEALDVALNEKNEQFHDLKNQLTRIETLRDAEVRAADEKLALLQETETRMKRDFENLASRIFDEKNKAFKQQSTSDLNAILNPFKEQLGEFRQKVEQFHVDETKDRSVLIEQVRQLQDLNQQVTKDTQSLTMALKRDQKAQGDWGEVILESILEQSGLRKGHEYELQTHLTSEEGQRRRPDVIIRLPEGKDVIIDAKVSLVAYLRYATLSDEAEKAKALAEHIESIKRHLRDLNHKEYQSLPGVHALDFVLMFIPIEPAFLLVMEKEPSLYAMAHEKHRVMLVCPSTLMPILKTIEYLWRQERQNKNAELIAKKAGQLYDKFVGFSEALLDVGAHLDKAKLAYETSRNRLRDGKGSLVKRIEDIRELGARAAKSMPLEMLESSGDSEDEKD